ncbi:MAG: phenylalanine--tRNA ligase subunit beta, partial [Thermoguttaceae bacterium]
MLISLDWISDYVDLSGIDPKDIANKLTLSTAEVEGTEKINRFVDGVLVGKVTAAEVISDKEGKKLTFCTVDCGNKTYTTVCGAPNARVGLIAPFAPAGTTLAGNVKIEKGEMCGKPSEGILCSASELGMSSWHEIVFECPENTKIGELFANYVPKSDTLIEIDNKSLTHRPDLWGHYGFARELAAIYGRELKLLPRTDLSAFDNLAAYPLKVEDYENCPAYGCVEFVLGTPEQPRKSTVPAPIFMQRRLHALGQRTYNLLIDVTNYVNQEIGQPTHAFDGDLVQGILVGQSGKNRKFQTLDGQDRQLIPEDLIIFGDVKTSEKTAKSEVAANTAVAANSDAGKFVPVALAGIMGGRETEVSDKTEKILLESANFRAARIRRTSTRLDLRTDASQRYEKSQPPCNVRVGAERIVNLIEQAGLPLKVTSKFTTDGNLGENWRNIVIESGKLQRLSGIDLSQEKIVGILTSLGFKADFAKDGTLTVSVPPFRSEKDISIPEDIVEEVLRIYGYDNIPPVMPQFPLRPLHVENYI